MLIHSANGKVFFQCKVDSTEAKILPPEEKVYSISERFLPLIESPTELKLWRQTIILKGLKHVIKTQIDFLKLLSVVLDL